MKTSILSIESLEDSLLLAVETYSNIHRGVGYKSQITTCLYEEARSSIKTTFGITGDGREVVFSTPIVADEIMAQAKTGSIRSLSSEDIGLPLGVRVLHADRETFKSIAPPVAGGGSAMLVSRDSYVQTGVPHVLEAGTPAVLNVIAFAAAFLQGHGAKGNGIAGALSGAYATEDLLSLRDFCADDVSDRDALARFRESLIGRRYPVPTARGRQGYRNFDSAATTSVPLPVWNTVKMALRQRRDRRADAIRTVKREILDYLRADENEYEVIFTANATMAINLLARMVGDSRFGDEPFRVLNSWFEHNSNEIPWRRHPNVRVGKIPLGADGFVDMRALAALLATGKYGMVSFCGASNVAETGMSVKRLCEAAHERGAFTFVDASQSLAHSRVDMDGDGIDFLAFSGHKAYAPFGIGALVGRKSVTRRLEEIHPGYAGAMEENFVGIAALGKALRLLSAIGPERIEAEERRLASVFVQGLSPGRVTFPVRAAGGICAFNLRGIPHNRCAQILAEDFGAGVRNGCFCSHLFVKRLLGIRATRASLAALFVRLYPRGAPVLPGLVRVCISVENDEESVRGLLAAIARARESGRGLASRLLSLTANGLPRLPVTDVTRSTREEARELAIRIFGRIGS